MTQLQIGTLFDRRDNERFHDLGIVVGISVAENTPINFEYFEGTPVVLVWWLELQTSSWHSVEFIQDWYKIISEAD